MTINFFYLISLSLWIGGSAVIAFLCAPVIFKLEKSRTLAGEITGEILKRFDIVISLCIVVLCISSFIKYTNWENATLWIILKYSLLILMAISALFSQFIISPKMETLKESISSFDNTPKNDPLRLKFRELHKVSFGCLLLNICLGCLVLFFS